MKTRLRHVGKRLLRLLAAAVVLGAVSMGVYYHGYKLYQDNKAVPDVLRYKEADSIFIRGTMLDERTARRAAQQKNRGLLTYTNMDAQSRKLIQLVRDGAKEIVIDIDSGGGMVSSGMRFVNNLKDAQSNGVTITCVVTGNAMSMALITFSECDNRYAVFGTRLLWHSALFGYQGYLNQGKLIQMLTHISDMNLAIWTKTRRYFYPWYFLEHFDKESRLSASELEREGFGYLRVINKVRVIKAPAPKVITKIVVKEKVVIKEVPAAAPVPTETK